MAAGATFGVLLLCKPSFVFLVPLLPAWGWFVFGRPSTAWLRPALLLLLAGLVVLPWTVRNWYVMQAVIPFGTGGGMLLLCTNNRIVIEDPALYGYSVMDNAISEYSAELKSIDDEVRRDARAKELAIAWLTANPDKWFYLARKKFVRLWTPRYQGSKHRGLMPIVSGYYCGILLLFAAGVLPVTARFMRQRHPALLMQMLILATTGTAMLFHGQHRYRFPVDSLCLVIGLGAMFLAIDWVSDRTWPKIRADLLGILVRHRLACIAAVSLAVGLGYWTHSDEQQITAFRNRVCQQRIDAVTEAAFAYQSSRGTWPPSLLELVPEYLPDFTALHCPWHSIGWGEYGVLVGQDRAAAAALISYELRVESAQRAIIVERRDVAVGHSWSDSPTTPVSPAAGSELP